MTPPTPPPRPEPSAPDDVRIVHLRQGGGEFVFCPDVLILCVYLGPPLRLEQVSEGRVWRGVCARGDLQVMVPGAERVFRHRSVVRHAHLTVGGALLADLVAERGELRPRLALRDEPLRHIAEALLAESAEGPASRLFREAAGRAAVARLVELDGHAEREARHGLSPRVLARVLEYLEAHLAEDVSVEDLARVAGLSAAHFATLFRHSTGEPPHRHQVRRRVERARQLLERGADPATAAAAVGFYDQSHLARHMRRLLDVTPGDVARARRSPKERPAARRDVQESLARHR